MNIKKLFNIELTSKCFDFLKKAWRFFFCSTSYKRRVFEKEPISSSCLGLVHESQVNIIITPCCEQRKIYKQ